MCHTEVAIILIAATVGSCDIYIYIYIYSSTHISTGSVWLCFLCLVQGGIGWGAGSRNSGRLLLSIPC